MNTQKLPHTIYTGETGLNQNLLHKEQSPYLLQHAENPVHWHAWNEEAFQKAKNENKPVFLSIGYATCHWCHVMAHESFEDEEIAGLMNDAFVNIKVDREERPDIDNTYMTVCQMVTGHGGWPLTIIMTPDKKPFFAATYIPKDSHFERIGMRQLIPAIEHHWKNEYSSIEKAVESISEGYKLQQQFVKTDQLGSEVINRAVDDFRTHYDEEYGGFGSAPKFPTPHNLSFLLRHAFLNKDEETLHMVTKTLKMMRFGGLFDQIGYGFHRYSTDQEWILPHFEKMLYDQALLMRAYTDAYQYTGELLFKQTVYEISEYVQRDLYNGDGGYYSAEDADSEGVEGKFYTWTYEELKEILSPAEFAIFMDEYHIRKEGNFKDESTRKLNGTNILYLKSPDFLMDPRLLEIREKLQKHRGNRVRPLLDDKILTDWNALMISAYARAAFVFDDDSFLKLARKGISFIENHLVSNSRLLHRYRNGEAGIQAFADDYAFLIQALIECYESTFESEYLTKAIFWKNEFIKQLWDEDEGAFFFSRVTDSDSMGSQKLIYDGAIPSANSVAMLNLLKLHKFTGNADYANRADEMIKLFGSNLSKHGSHHAQAMQALQFSLRPSQEIVLAEADKGEDIKAFVDEIRKRYLPNAIVMRHPAEGYDLIYEFSDFIKQKKPRNNQTTAFVCEDFSCKHPVNTSADFSRILDQISG